MSNNSCTTGDVSTLLRRGLASAFALTLVAACGGGADSEAQSAPGAAGDSGKVTSVTVGIPPAPSGAIIGYAQEKGLFAKYKLDVKTTALNGGSAAVPALQGGAIQIAQSNVLSIIQGEGQGLDVPCFAGAFNFGSEPTFNYVTLIAGPKSGLSSAKELVGKTVAVNATGGVNELATNAYLASQSVDYGKVKYIAIPFPNMPAALAAGQVDAAVTPDPFAAQMLAGGGKLLSSNVVASVEGNPTYACWNATGKWLGQNPEAARNFVRAMEEASAAVTADFGSFREFLKTKGGTPPAIADNLGVLEFSVDMTEDDVVKWQKAAKKFGILEGSDVKPGKAYAPMQR